MKKIAAKICSFIGLVMLIAVVSAQAQIQYRAHVPFDFSVGQENYEAGNYVIDSVSPHSGIKAIAIRDAKGRKSYMMMTTQGENFSRIETATLVFNRNGAQYSLAAIRTPSFIVTLAKSRAKETIGQNPKVQERIVTLVKKS